MGSLIKKIYINIHGNNKKILKTIIDYITTKQNLKLKIQDVRAYRGPNCGTDHKLVAAKILFPYISTTKDKNEEKKEDNVAVVYKKRQCNIDSLQNESIKLLYQQRLNSKLNRNEFEDTEEMYKYLKNCIHEALKEALGEKEANKRRATIFWNAEIEKERQNKKQLFLKWLSTKDHNDKLQYKIAQTKIRRMITNNRNELWDKKCLEIQTCLGSKTSSESWKFIKNIVHQIAIKDNLI
jgi:hypothetical protein